MRFNRSILKCKFDILKEQGALEFGLIEAYWNVNEVGASWKRGFL